MPDGYAAGASGAKFMVWLLLKLLFTQHNLLIAMTIMGLNM